MGKKREGTVRRRKEARNSLHRQTKSDLLPSFPQTLSVLSFLSLSLRPVAAIAADKAPPGARWSTNEDMLFPQPDDEARGRGKPRIQARSCFVCARCFLFFTPPPPREELRSRLFGRFRSLRTHAAGACKGYCREMISSACRPTCLALKGYCREMMSSACRPTCLGLERIL